MRKLKLHWDEKAKAGALAALLSVVPTADAHAQTRGYAQGQCPVFDNNIELRTYKDGYVRALSDLQTHYGLPRAYHCAAQNTNAYWQGFTDAYNCSARDLAHGRPTLRDVSRAIDRCFMRAFDRFPNN